MTAIIVINWMLIKKGEAGKEKHAKYLGGLSLKRLWTFYVDLSPVFLAAFYTRCV